MSIGPVLDAATLAALRRLAQSRPRSGRRKQPMPPMPPMPEGWYPHEPGHPFYELDWVFLHEHPEILRRHWEAAFARGRM